MLALEFAKGHRSLYLFVSKKSEPLLCAEYLEEIKKTFEIPVYGEIRHFRDVFALLLDLAKKERFTLIIDEFQEFYGVNPAVYSEIQHLWDVNKSACGMNLICIGSVYSLMHRSSKRPRNLSSAARTASSCSGPFPSGTSARCCATTVETT
jgi:hypothetical protein